MSTTGYTSKVVYSSKELSAIERYKAADFGDAISFDELLKDGDVILDFSHFAEVEVHNPHSKNDEDYTKYVVFDKFGTKYVTGSETFASEIKNILSELEGVDGWQLKVFKRPSRNFSGDFITCTIV